MNFFLSLFLNLLSALVLQFFEVPNDRQCLLTKFDEVESKSQR